MGHDPNLSSWAAENNNQQNARGMGHFVMGPARRQNAAFGSYANIGAMWMNSPAHRAGLLAGPDDSLDGDCRCGWLTGRSTRIEPNVEDAVVLLFKHRPSDRM